MAGQVLVQVVDLDVSGRTIKKRGELAQQLTDRAGDIRDAVTAGTSSVIESLPAVADSEGWRCSEVTASFGITLTAEAGVIVSKASTGATFEVTVKVVRTNDSDGG